jgi:hypothetical protein
MLSGVVVHTCHPNAWEAETGESQVGGQPGLLNQILSQTNKQSTIALWKKADSKDYYILNYSNYTTLYKKVKL